MQRLQVQSCMPRKPWEPLLLWWEIHISTIWWAFVWSRQNLCYPKSSRMEWSASVNTAIHTEMQWIYYLSGVLCLVVDRYSVQNCLLIVNKCFFCPSVLRHCWLGVRKSIQPVKINWWGVGVGVVICLEWGADCLRMVQLMPLPLQTPSCLASFKSRLVLPLPNYPGCPGRGC